MTTLSGFKARHYLSLTSFKRVFLPKKHILFSEDFFSFPTSIVTLNVCGNGQLVIAATLIESSGLICTWFAAENTINQGAHQRK